ncbi:TOMM precursor leader peptide-binding protein [Streptomyces sp. RKAG337]|uniref:TOMM precursor leader peptide-binding protein n=1 Tax=Streptomyces sp. RKAG337 TaxID=2893404 RepID=UPI002033D8FA|nr:TOMM precursor leader peptide-binding protein [Streptomyces sp. RKAG337]MCM2426303.1 TOMM precursor leader peptide-binding protein [Streptomyces sp. RKAG337]
MRPMLKTAMRRSWRNRESVQFGIDPAHAVVLDSVDGAAAGFLDLLDGTRGAALLTRDAEALGLGAQQVRQLLGLLAEGGVLDDAAAHARLSEAVRHRTAAIDRLRPDLAALSVVHAGPGGAAGRMRDRRAARVRVRGAGRVGAAVAALLSAAGVGRVEVLDGGRVEPWDVSPAGIPAEHIGERRDAAARGAVRRAAPDPRAAALGRRGPRAGRGPGSGYGPGREPEDSRLSLVVVAPRDGLAAYAPEPREAERLLAAGIPHLYTGVVEGMGVVGPLVVPGRTGCAGCLALRLADADPAWPRMLAQLRSGRAPAVPACDIALATTVAGLAAAHALAFLDGGSPPSSGARVEIALARLSMEVRPVPGDIRCGCGAGSDARTVLPAAPRVRRGTMAG